MTDFNPWITAQIDTIRNCTDCLEERKADRELALTQLWAIKRHIDSMIDFMEWSKSHGTS